MKTTGYSGTSLVKKLGIKDGFKLLLVNEPDYYLQLFQDFPATVEIVKTPTTGVNIIHYFTKEALELQNDIVGLKNGIKQNGMIWISWPKKASKVATDLDEDIIRRIALQNGLVDIKVCAIDEIWSGLKLVIPVKDRNAGK